MLLIRRFEEKCVELYSASEIRGFVHLYIGEEAVAVGVNQALTPADSIVSTYREHGHALVRGIPLDSVMAEMFGKTTGCSHGRGGSMHLFDVQRRFYGGNAIVGGGLPLAIGVALADRMRGEDRVTACFFGDGAVAEGGTLPKALAAAGQLSADGIDAEVIDLRSLRPLDDATIMASVARTHRAVIIDEGWRSGSLAAEVSARITEQAFYDLDAPVARVCSAEVPMPYPRHLEEAALPQPERIVAAAHEVVG
jgi:hypothetical protein